MILSIRTDRPEAEIGIFGADGSQIAYESWLAHRELGVTVHRQIKKLLDANSLGWSDIDGIVFYEGPGSFTGLRIGASVANALAEQTGVRLAQATGEDWIARGIDCLNDDSKSTVVPLYGNDPHITKPRK